MKYTMITLALTAGAASGWVQADDDDNQITVGGVIAVAAESASDGDISRGRVVDNGSKLHVKGEHSIGKALHFNWYVDSKVNPDEGGHGFAKSGCVNTR